jgi:hypothetical protein
MQAANGKGIKMGTTSEPTTIEDFKARALAKFEMHFESGKIVSQADCKKLLRTAFSEQAAQLDLPAFTRHNPQVFEMANIGIGGAPGTIGEVVAAGIATFTLRSLKDYANRRFIDQFEGKLPEVLADLTDRSLTLFAKRPNQTEPGHDQFNVLSGLKSGLSDVDLEFAEEAIRTLVAFGEFLQASPDVFYGSEVTRVKNDIAEVGKLTYVWPGILGNLLPQQGMTI